MRSMWSSGSFVEFLALNIHCENKALSFLCKWANLQNQAKSNYILSHTLRNTHVLVYIPWFGTWSHKVIIILGPSWCCGENNSIPNKTLSRSTQTENKEKGLDHDWRYSSRQLGKLGECRWLKQSNWKWPVTSQAWCVRHGKWVLKSFQAGSWGNGSKGTGLLFLPACSS